MPKLKQLPVLGKTEDGKLVVGDVFKLYDTYGMPLWMIIAQCRQRDLVIGWHEFYLDAIKAGWKHKTIMMRVAADLNDALDGSRDIFEYGVEVLHRFETWMNPDERFVG